MPSASQWWTFIKIAHWWCLQALDDPALPQRAVQVEGTLQGVGDGPGQLGVVARLRQGHPSHMVGEVESRIVDPLLDAIERVRQQHLRAPRYRLNSFCQQSF